MQRNKRVREKMEMTEGNVTKKLKVDLEEVEKTEEDNKEDADSEDDFMDLQKRRTENIRQNQQFFAQLGILSAKKDLKEVTSKPKSVTRGFKEKEKANKEKEVLPMRMSLRIRNIAPDGTELPPKQLQPLFSSADERPRRKHAENILMKDCIVTELSGHEDFLETLGHLQQPTTTGKNSSLDSFIKSLNKLTMSEKTVAKVVPTRIFSLLVHPTEDKKLVIAGDKWGRLGFWDVESDANQDGVFVYEPHTRPIKSLLLDPENASHLYSASYDGTVRCCHLDQAVFTQVYSTPEDDQILLYSCESPDPNTLLVGQSDGLIVQVDCRSSTPGHQYNVGRGAVRCLSVHPVNRQYLASAHSKNCVLLWDLRHMKPKHPLCELTHGKMVESAYFSPISGDKLLTISLDNSIGVYDSTNVADCKLDSSIRHNNYTGRWLSNFRACWHPRREDVFVVGSMAYPRKIEVWSSEGELMKELMDAEHLGSVSSMTAFHPTLNFIAGGNSSGKVHVFK